MIVAIGIDLVEISRIEEVLARRGERFLSRVFTDSEIGYCESRASSAASYAARFAAKEAAMKALGTGWSDGIAWRDIEVVSASSGAPALVLRGRALERIREIGVTRTHVSLGHSSAMAIAQVVLEAG
ncbi:MAG TPA: holo-ACP synthase [Blastocatellia bacterium]|nr:holo-ACP synthase [Blastocatellia bacterium]